MLSTRNTKTAALALLNSLHTAFVLSAEIERNLILRQLDVAYQNIGTLETTINELRNKNDSLAILGSLVERVGVLRDILAVETEKMWSTLVLFSEEGDIQMTIQRQSPCAFPSLYSISTLRFPLPGLLGFTLTVASAGNSSSLTIAGVADLLKTLNLLDSTMKNLASLLSRAFLDHLLENPVGWQFIYRKHDPQPSITMTPTNFVPSDDLKHACNSHCPPFPSFLASPPLRLI